MRGMWRVDRNKVLAGARKAFFKAMLAGYVGDKDTNGLRFNVGDYIVIDKWVTTPFSDCSAGTITIFLKIDNQEIPVWWMSYSGSYSWEAIPFLKKALERAYKKGKFFGGRGPYRVTFTGDKKIYIYSNPKVTLSRQTFRWFRGEEIIIRIRRKDGHRKILGTHRYQGRALI